MERGEDLTAALWGLLEYGETALGGWSPRWESNPRPTPYQGVALPLSHLGQVAEPGDGTR